MAICHVLLPAVGSGSAMLMGIDTLPAIAVGGHVGQGGENGCGPCAATQVDRHAMLARWRQSRRLHADGDFAVLRARHGTKGDRGLCEGSADARGLDEAAREIVAVARLAIASDGLDHAGGVRARSLYTSELDP